MQYLKELGGYLANEVIERIYETPQQDGKTKIEKVIYSVLEDIKNGRNPRKPYINPVTNSVRRGLIKSLKEQGVKSDEYKEAIAYYLSEMLENS